MKVYIITEGCYSDYHIEAVFTDKLKAEEYVKIRSDCEIEKYDTLDDTYEIGKHKQTSYISVIYKKYLTSNKEEISIQVINTNDIEYPDIEEYPYNYKYFAYHDFYSNKEWNYIGVSLNYPNPNNLNQDDIEGMRQKYLTICRDYIAKAYSLHDIDGYSWEQIKEMLFN